MGNLPLSGAALEAVGVPAGEHQIGRGAVLFLAPMDSEEVALAVRDVAIDFSNTLRQ